MRACRKNQGLIGEDCEKPREVCFMMGSMGEYYLDRGMAREVGVLDRCQTAAISMNEDDCSEIDLIRCIGCGLCVITCSTEALSLVPKPKDRRRTPPLDTRGQMDLIRQLRKPA
jgi:ferredoxin